MKFKTLRKFLARSFPFFIRRYFPKSLIKHLYFSGVFDARLYGKKVTKLMHIGHQIENEIYWRGFESSHEGMSLQLWTRLIEIFKPQVIWDIGANSGSYGLLAKAIFPQSKVFFFEPIPKAIQLIHENLKLNNYKGKVFNFALGDYDGQGRIYLPSGNQFPTSVTVNKNTTGEGGKFDMLSVDVYRADTLIKRENLQLPQLIKIDVETYEPEVLCGFGSVFPPECIFLIEILENENALKLQTIFPPSTYVFFNIDDRGKTFRQTDTLEKSDFYNYLVLPRKMEYKFLKEWNLRK